MATDQNRVGLERVSGPDWQTYVRAERLLPWNAPKLVFNVDVEPHWINDSSSFWYRADRGDGTEFLLVDPAAGTKTPAFDHARLAAVISSTLNLPCTATTLPFDSIDLDPEGRTIEFDARGKRWRIDLSSYVCAEIEGTTPVASDAVRSPNGAHEAFVRDRNLWLRDVRKKKERALTSDGIEGFGYGSPLSSPLEGAGLAEADKPAVLWSPDGSKFASCRVDERDALKFHLVQSIPKDGSVRPVLHTYSYPLPGDTRVPQAEIWIFDAEKGKGVKAKIDPLQMLYYGAPIYESMIWWDHDASTLFLLKRDRGFLSYRLIAIDTKSGTARDVIVETFERGIDPYLYWAAVNVRVLAGGKQIIWYAYREGWGHLYLYDTQSGKQIRQLTTGTFNVTEIAHVDEAKRFVYFRALGREEDRDPYLSHTYRVSLDGGEPDLLTPEPADHTVKFAPNGEFFIDTYSTVDVPPVSVLRSADSSVVAELEHADVANLISTGWRAPERFHAKGRDGITDVFGAILRPSNFDASKKYPVIDSIYAGPQRNQAPIAFAGYTTHEAGRRGVGSRWYWQAQALAELGFIVVMMDGMGMPGRSKQFHDVTYLDIGDGGLPDHITAIQELADRYPAFDLDHVGIYGHSAGGYASAHALLTYPDFYHAAVSSAGNHDHRLDKASWVERYMGFEVKDHYRQQANQTLASRLKGKLLLIHGELDENVHPSSTIVVVDELIKANKDFDLLIMPNMPHACDDHPYFVRKRWDYFVRHLQNAEPPSGYQIEGKKNWTARWS